MDSDEMNVPQTQLPPTIPLECEPQDESEQGEIQFGRIKRRGARFYGPGGGYLHSDSDSDDDSDVDLARYFNGKEVEIEKQINICRTYANYQAQRIKAQKGKEEKETSQGDSKRHKK